MSGAPCRKPIWPNGVGPRDAREHSTIFCSVFFSCSVNDIGWNSAMRHETTVEPLDDGSQAVVFSNPYGYTVAILVLDSGPVTSKLCHWDRTLEPVN